MKIIFVYSSPFPRISGHTAADRRVRDIIRGLVYAGMDVSLATPSSHDLMVDKGRIEDFVILRLGKKINRRLFVIERITFWVDLLYEAKIQDAKAVFFYNTNIDSAIPAIILKAFRRRIFWEICDLHSDLSKRITFRQTLARVSELVFSRVSNEVFVISRFLESHVKKLNKSVSTSIVPIIVDSDQFFDLPCSGEVRRKNAIPDDVPIISYIGGMWKHQGVGNLLQAFASVIRNGERAKLLIAGNYEKSPLHDDVPVIVRELGLTDEVILPGWVTTKGVQEILAESDILVLGQLDEDFTRAGLPTKLAEYCAAGKAIIATDVGDVVLYLKHELTAYICKPNSVSEMAVGISKLLADQELREYLGKNAKRLAVERFCYKSIGLKIAKVIDACR